MRGPAAQRLRRALILVCGALVVVAVWQFLSLQITYTHGGSNELINGQADTDALALPLALFLIGASGLLAALGWRPHR